MSLAFHLRLHRYLRNPRQRFRPAKGPAVVARSCRPRLEVLEDRILPSTFLVTNLDDHGSGSLRAAVQSADLDSGSTINFAANLHGTIKLTGGELDITTSMTINGAGAGQLAVSGCHASRIFDVSGSNSNVTISGLTIRDGMAFGKGGGIFNQGSTLTLSNDVLSDNQALGDRSNTIGQGGGVYNSGGNVTISQSKLSGNLARGADRHGSSGTGQGGGIANGAGGLFTARGVLFIDNEAVGGAGGGDARGGALLNQGTAILYNSTFRGNQAVGGDGGTGADVGVADGGAISSYGVTAVTDGTFDSNRALGGSNGRSGNSYSSPFVDCGLGGGVAADGGVISITNSSFRNNQAIGGNNGTAASPNDISEVGGAEGGALFSEFGATASISSSTFDHNQAIGGNGNRGSGSVVLAGEGLGGAIVSGYGTSTLSTNTLSVSDSTFTGNQAVGGYHNTGAASVSALVGVGAGAGIANYAGGTATVSDSTLDHNRALGGNGNTVSGTGTNFANCGVGGAIFNYLGGYNSPAWGLFSANSVMVTGSTLDHNRAEGGHSGDGLGGGWANIFDAGATVISSTISANHAVGGPHGGNGFGGGLYNDATSNLTLMNDTVTYNHAHAGWGGEGIGGGIYKWLSRCYRPSLSGSDGEGIGGGIYNLGVLTSLATTVTYNHASTSNDDIYGLTVPNAPA
jgi:hypothetical protein